MSNLSRYQKVIPEEAINPSKPAKSLTSNQSYDEDIVKGSGKTATPVTASGQTLQNLYGKVAETSGVGQEINTEKDAAKQAAYVDYQRLMKYLNFANAAQGGQTLTAGDKIQAENNYQSQLMNIDKMYKPNETGEDEAVIAEQQEYWNSLLRDTIDQKMGNFEVNEDTGAISAEDWKSLWTLYEGKKDKMNEFQQEVMEFYLNTIDHDAETAEVVTKQGNKVQSQTQGNGVAQQSDWVIAGAALKASPFPTEYATNGQIIGDGAGGTYIFKDGLWYPAKRK